MTVLLVGPVAIRGPGFVAPEAATEALACIDDELALVGERAVRVDDLWVDVLRAAAGPSAGDVVLVVPSWWPPERVGRVEAAGRRAGLALTSRPRSASLRRNGTHVVEVAPDVIAIHPPGRDTVLVPRVGRQPAVVDDVVANLREAVDVLIDDPVGGFGSALAQRLRMRRVRVDVADDEMLRSCPPRRSRFRLPPIGPRVAVAAAASAVVVALCGAAVWHGTEADERGATTWLVEGRVAVEVPADWVAERIVDGPGSARVEVESPAGEVIHLTQSPIPAGQPLSAAADVVCTALAAQSETVFTAFDPAAEVAGVAAMTYRENRPGRHVDWTLVLDGAVRIAIGCQGTDAVPAPEEHCLHAVRTARAIA